MQTVHHMYTIIDLGQLSKFGVTYWLPLASAANIAQGGATLAVAPVSYTHLDVYKRQAVGKPSLKRALSQ